MAKTILVADDEECIITLNKRLFEPKGYNVVTAEDGEKALAYLDKNTIDLLITDYDMPKLKGPELIKILREKGAKFPIALATTYSENEIIEKYGKLYDYHFQKPLDIISYRAKITEILEN
jgi:CheY-like chemotaxis protein